MSSNSNLIKKLEPMPNWTLIAPAFTLLIWIGVTFFLYANYCLYLAVDYLEASISIMIL